MKRKKKSSTCKVLVWKIQYSGNTKDFLNTNKNKNGAFVYVCKRFLTKSQFENS